MRALPPHIEVPGDNAELLWLANGKTVRPNIMRRSGECVGMTAELAVWRFGFSPESEYASAFGVHFTGQGFLWVLATRRTATIRETFEGYAVDLPPRIGRVIEP